MTQETAGNSTAATPPPEQKSHDTKPPHVWLDMDQKQLDDAYDQRSGRQIESMSENAGAWQASARSRA